MAKTHHIVHNPNGGWDVKKGGADQLPGTLSIRLTQ